jgi:hypothetical protein
VPILVESQPASNINIKKVDCAYNKLTELNLKGLTNLTYLDFTHNKLSTIDIEELGLVIFECRYNYITDKALIDYLIDEFGEVFILFQYGYQDKALTLNTNDGKTTKDEVIIIVKLQKFERKK